MPGSPGPSAPLPQSPDDALDVDAAYWWLQHSEGRLADPCSALARSFQAWLAADARHAAAWAATQAASQALDELPATSALTLRTLARASTARAPAKPARRPWLQGAVAAALLVGAGGLGLWWPGSDPSPTYARDFRTGRGQLLSVTLPDGSRLRLDTATAVRVRLFDTRRSVELLQGQVLAEVAHDKTRPFSVDAAGLRTTAVGTRFQVRHVDAGVGVAVEEGRVRVQAIADGELPAPLLLDAGQAVDRDAAGRLGEVQALAPTAMAPWTRGRLSFDATPLGQALAEFERYGETGVRMALDPRVAALRVTGSFEIGRVQDFVAALPRVLPVRLQKVQAQWEIVPLP